MKICFTSLGCPDWTVEEVARRAAQMGAYGVELRAKAPDLHVSADTPASRVREIRRLFADAGVRIVGITGYTTFAGADPATRHANEAQLVRNLALCAELGADYVRTFIGESEDAEGEVCRRAGESLRRAVETAAGIPAAALIETHDFAATGRVARRILDCAACPPERLGAIWDISHPPKGGEAPEETFRHLGPFVQAVHVKDECEQRLENGEIQQCFPGLGIMPLRRCLEVLRAGGYGGYYVVEWERAFNMNLAPLPEAFAREAS